MITRRGGGGGDTRIKMTDNFLETQHGYIFI